MAKQKNKSGIMTLSDLRPAAYNPRVIAERAKKGLNRSIEKFGDLSGITFNARTGNLVTGHQRVEQLRSLYGELDIPETPDVAEGGEAWATFRDPEGRSWKVRFVHQSLDWEMEANIVANNPSIAGTYTSDVASMLDHIKTVSPADFDSLYLQDIYELPPINLSAESTENSDSDGATPPARVLSEWVIEVECTSEIHRMKTMEKLIFEGYTCRRTS